MLYRLRRRMQNEQGFTLIELLVVILIIGILAAVAIPTFLNQRGKGYDANAQSVVKDMQTAAETFATGDNGTYPTTVTQLLTVDPSLNTSSVASTAMSGGGSSADSYTVSAVAQSTGDSFSIVENNGSESNTCTSTTTGGGPGGCPSGSTW
jgi:type IV pilus assembly protein PilA